MHCRWREAEIPRLPPHHLRSGQMPQILVASTIQSGPRNKPPERRTMLRSDSDASDLGARGPLQCVVPVGV